MRKKSVYFICYFLMALRVFVSFFSWFDLVLLTVVIVSLLDAIDGLIPYLIFKGNIDEFKHKIDYIVDMISRTIFLVPTFSFIPAELVLWFVAIFIWYYFTTMLRVITGNPWFVAFTAPVNILVIGVGILRFLNLDYILLVQFLIIGMAYEFIWHGTFYFH